MRICSPQLGLNPKSILGGEVFDREILLGLAKRGVKIEIILSKNKEHDKNIKNWNVTYLPFSRFPAILGNFLIIPYLFLIYNKRPFNILRIHSPKFLGLGCIFFGLFNKKIKLVATYHKFEEANFGPFSKRINKSWDHIICDSNYVEQKLIKNYQIQQSKITVVHNGVPIFLRPTPKYKKLIKEFNLDDKIVLLFMGLFIKRKNPLFLVDVMAKLSRTRSDIVLLFWGSGLLKSQIIKKARELNVFNNIRLIAPVFGSDKNRIHNLADIFVHPALDEGFALAPLEAMACAKPIIMTNGFSADEAVEDGINGYLCQSNNLEDWSNKLNSLIKNHSLRKKMGEASLSKIKEEFLWRESVNKHFQIMKNLNNEN